MMRFCSVTGRLAHKFDRVTHRCVCGRWERGFKPKVERVKPVAECQVCEGQQARNADGTMVHHGYQRPGHGFIVGDCCGVNHQPFPATDALEKWLKVINHRLRFLRARLRDLPKLNEIEYAYQERTGFASKPTTKFVMLRKGDPTRLYAGRWLPKFDDEIQFQIRKVQQSIEWAKEERRRVALRIAKGKLAQREGGEK